MKEVGAAPDVSVPRPVPRDFSGAAQLAGMVLGSLLEGPAGADVRHLLVAFPGEPGLAPIWAPAFPATTFLYDDHAVLTAERRRLSDGGPENLRLLFGWRPAEALASADSEADSHRPAPDLALLFLPKGNDAIEAAYSGVARALAPGGRLLVVGAKKSGIASSRKLARRYLREEGVSRSARHAKMYAYRRPAGQTAGEPPAFDGHRTYTATAWGREIEVVTLPGVFSHGALDDGTRYLLEELDPAELGEPGAALDFGCGAGVLTAALRLAWRSARVDAARVDAVDRQAQALEATRRTLQANGLSVDDPAVTEPAHGRVFPSDVFSDVTGRYDLILSNPPFHSGHATDFSMTHRLIAEAGHHLTPDGRLVMVTNTFIDYLTPLRAAFHRVQALHQTPRYRITHATRPKIP